MLATQRWDFQARVPGCRKLAHDWRRLGLGEGSGALLIDLR